MIGAFLLPDTWRGWDRAAAELVLSTLQGAGVDWIVTECDEYRDDVIAWSHDHGMRFAASVSCFSDHAHDNQAAQARPELWPVTDQGEQRHPMEWYLGLSPVSQELRSERLETIERVVREHQVDALYLDFVRFPLHWELECRPGLPPPATSSFDDLAVAAFAAQRCIDIPPGLGLAARAAWILEHAASAWHEFRCDVITEFVASAAARARAVRPLEVGVFVVPLSPASLEQLVGQRLRDLAGLVDWLAPMTYHAMLHRDPQWIGEILSAHEAIAPGRVVPVIQADTHGGAALGADWGPAISDSEWTQALEAARASTGSESLVVFPGTALLAGGRLLDPASPLPRRKAKVR